jgi:hypothetical protein
LVPLVALLAAGSAYGGDLAAIKARGSLRVLVASDEQPEMFSLQAAFAPGFDRELLGGFASLNRVKLEPVVKPFDEIIAALVKDEGDVIVGLVDTQARRKLIGFTAEVLPTRHVVLTRRPDPAITTLAALREARLGVVAGTSWADAVAAAGVPAARTESFAELGEVLQALRSRRITAPLCRSSTPRWRSGRSLPCKRGSSLGTPATPAMACAGATLRCATRWTHTSTGRGGRGTGAGWSSATSGTTLSASWGGRKSSELLDANEVGPWNGPSGCAC